METLKVWNMFEVNRDGDFETFVGTYASVERARAEVDERHPAAAANREVQGYLILSGGYVHVFEGDRVFALYRIQQVEVQS